MKNTILFFFILIAGCTSQTREDKTEDVVQDSSVSEKVTPRPLLVPGCYSWITKQDSALLKLDVLGNDVSGDLKYFIFEKDNNKGTIRGTLHDSLIVADYTFQSEGMTSVRQVVFKIHGDSLSEGFGDIDMKSDTARFKDISELQFQNERSFIKTDCK